jgi:hypothetical protein
MIDQQKTTQEKGTPFDLTSCMAMMQKMMGGQEGGCDCAEMMSQMMATCCGVQDETEERTATEATQKA